MSERIRKTIYEIEYKSDSATVAKSTETLQRAETQFDKTTQAAKEFETEQKKVATESQKVGAAVDNTGKKFTSLGQSIQKAGDNIGKLQQFRGLQKVFDDNANALTPFISQIEKLKSSLANNETVEQMKDSLNEFKASLPSNLQASIGDKLINEFDKLNNKLQTPTARLREIRNLLLAGGLPADQVIKLRNEAARLTEGISDLKIELRNLGDNKLGFNALADGAQGAFGALSAFEGIMALTTDSSEDLQKAMLRAQGALAALTGVQQLVNSLQRESAFVVGLQTAAQKVQNFFVDEATGKVKKLNVALALSVAGIIIAGIVALAKNWEKVAVSLGFATKAQQDYSKIQSKAAESVGEEFAQLAFLERQVQSTNTTQEDRIEIYDELNKKYPTLLANLDKEKVTNEQLAAAILKVKDALFAKAQFDASLEILNEKFVERNKLVLQQITQTGAQLTEATRAGDEIARKALTNIGNVSLALNISVEEAIARENALIQKDIDELDSQINNVLDLSTRFKKELDVLGGDPSRDAPKNEIKKDTRLAELQEQERHTIALLQLEKDSELKILQTRLDFAKKKLDILKSTKGVEKLELKRALNEISEIQAQIDKRVIAPDLVKGSIDFLSAEISKLEAAMNAVEGKSDEFFAILDKLAPLKKQLEELQELTNPKEAEKKEFSSDLDEAERHQTALLGIDGAGQQEILDTQIAFQKARIQELIEHNADVEEIEKAQNTLAELEAEKTAILRSEQEKRNQIIADGIIEVGNALADATSQFIDFQIRETDRLIQAQQGRVDAAKAIAEKGNAELLQLEEERLNELNKKRERFVRSQQALAAIQLVAEASLAVAKAAAEGGAAAPFTIAATLIALAVGLAQARALASQAAFYEGGEADWSKMGGYTGGNSPKGVSLAVGKKPYTYHQKEFIMDHIDTGIGNNLHWLNKIHSERIDLDKLFKSKVSMQFGGGFDDKRIVEAIENKPDVSLYLNSEGIVKIVKRYHKRNSKLQSRR